jgi:hypothetical protein
MLTAARLVRHAVGHAEAAEELLDAGRKVAAREAHGARAAVDLDAHRDHRRLHLLDDVGEADRPLGGVGARAGRKGRQADLRRARAGEQHGGAEAGNAGEKHDPARGESPARPRSDIVRRHGFPSSSVESFDREHAAPRLTASCRAD